jgi:hypothetical protein
MFRRSEQSRKAGGAVEAWPAQPIDGAVTTVSRPEHIREVAEYRHAKVGAHTERRTHRSGRTPAQQRPAAERERIWK